jgi:hypothetical protein
LENHNYYYITKQNNYHFLNMSYSTSFTGYSCNREGYVTDVSTQEVVCQIHEDNYYNFIVTNSGQTAANLQCDFIRYSGTSNHLVKFYIQNPDHNYLKVVLTDNGETDTYEFDSTIEETQVFYLPWCGKGEIAITATRSDTKPCEHCGNNCLIQDCEDGYTCEDQGGVYQCVKIPSECTTCGGVCNVPDCSVGQSCTYQQTGGYACVEEKPPCSSCGGECNVQTCGPDSVCTDTGAGQYECQVIKNTVISEWWFWLTIILTIIIFLLAIIIPIVVVRQKKQVIKNETLEIVPQGTK